MKFRHFYRSKKRKKTCSKGNSLIMTLGNFKKLLRSFKITIIPILWYIAITNFKIFKWKKNNLQQEGRRMKCQEEHKKLQSSYRAMFPESYHRNQPLIKLSVNKLCFLFFFFSLINGEIISFILLISSLLGKKEIFEDIKRIFTIFINLLILFFIFK